MDAKDLIELHKLAIDNVEKKKKDYDFLERGERVSVVIEDLSAADLFGMYDTMNKIQGVISSIGHEYGGVKEEKIYEPHEKISNIEEHKKEILPKLEETPENSETELRLEEMKKKIEERRNQKDTGVSLPAQKILERKEGGNEDRKIALEGILDNLENRKQKERSELENVQPKIEEASSQDLDIDQDPKKKEEYEKVKSGVGITYIDDHQVPVFSLPELDKNIEDTANKVILQIKENYKASGKTTETELSKRLIELTRIFLRTAGREEREKVRKEILEVKESLKARKEKKTVDPLILLNERQRSTIEQVRAEVEKEALEAVERVKKNYEEALSLADNDDLKSKIEKLREEDVSNLKQKLDIELKKYFDYYVKLHKREYELIKDNLSLGNEVDKYVAEMNNKHSEKFEQLKKEFLSKIEEFSTPKEQQEEKIEENTSSAIKQSGDKYQKIIEDIVAETSDMGRAAWLHYLGKTDRKTFWRYVRGEMDKKEAVLKGKELFVQDKANEFSLPKRIQDKLLEELLKKD